MKKFLRTLAAATVLTAGSALAETKLRLVEVITSPERTETLQGLVDDYEAANPGVEVEIVSLPWGQAFEKFATMVAGGDLPDVVEMPDRWLALYAGADKLMDLEDRIAGWEHGGTLTQKSLDMGRLAGGKAYTIPYGVYLRAMFSHQTVADTETLLAGMAELAFRTPDPGVEHDPVPDLKALHAGAQ